MVASSPPVGVQNWISLIRGIAWAIALPVTAGILWATMQGAVGQNTDRSKANTQRLIEIEQKVNNGLVEQAIVAEWRKTVDRRLDKIEEQNDRILRLLTREASRKPDGTP